MNGNPKIEMRPIDSITPYPNNPRHNQSAIRDVATSIRKYGFKQPIVVDKEGVIVVGHTRYEAAKELGLETVPVLVSELSDKENREYRIADNKTNELASWDFEKLAQEMADLDFGDFEFDTSFLDEIDEALNGEDDEDSNSTRPTRTPKTSTTVTSTRRSPCSMRATANGRTARRHGTPSSSPARAARIRCSAMA